MVTWHVKATECLLLWPPLVYIVMWLLINPEITEKSDEMVVADEGCLSFPGESKKIERHKSVYIKYKDDYGELKGDLRIYE